MVLVVFFFSRELTGAVAGVLAIGQVLGSGVSFLCGNHDEDQNIKLNKNQKYPNLL